MANRIRQYHPLEPFRPFAPPGITIFDTETTDLGKGYKRGRTNEVFLSQIAFFQSSQTGGPPDTMSYYTDILEPLVKRVEAGELTPEELITEATRIKSGSPRWSKDIRLKGNVLNRVFKSHLERTVASVRGTKLPSGVAIGPERHAVEQFIGRLKNKQTIGAWNMAFDYKVMAQAARRVGLGKEFGAVTREAGLDFSRIGTQSRLLDLSTTFKMFLFEENRRNALLEQVSRGSERSMASLVHLSDVEIWTAKAAGESQEAHTQFLRRVADTQGHPILGGADQGRLIERHGGFHTYFDSQTLAVPNALRRFEWFQRHGQDFGDQLSQQSFAEGKRTPHIDFVSGWNIDVLSRTLGLDSSKAHEALSDTVLEDKLSKIFGSYQRAFHDAEADIGVQFQGDRQLSRAVTQELAVLEGARTRFTATLQSMRRSGDLPPSAPATASEFWARHNFETIRNIRDKAAIHAAERLGIRADAVDAEIGQILDPTGARPKIIDTAKAAGDRLTFTASSVGRTLAEAFGEISTGAKAFLSNRMGQAAAAVAGIAIFDSLLPETAPAPPPNHLPKADRIRDPLAMPIGDVFHQLVQTHTIAAGAAQQAEVAIAGTSFHRPLLDTAYGQQQVAGHVDLLSNRYGPIEIKSSLKGGVLYHGGPAPEQIAQTRNYVQGLGLPAGYLYHINPSDPSNITINQVMAEGPRGHVSQFRRRMSGLRAANTPWSRWGGSGIRRGGGDFESGWNSVTAFTRIRPQIAAQSIAAAREAASAAEHVGVNTFSMGATATRAASELLQPQPISTRPIGILRLGAAIPDAGEKARAGRMLVEQAVENFGAINTQTRPFRGVSFDVDARIAGQQQTSGLPVPIGAAGTHIQQGMSQKAPAFYHGPRPWYDNPAREEIGSFIRTTSAGPFRITPGISGRGQQWVPHTEVLRGRRPAHEIVAMRPRPGWPASGTDFHWMEFGQIGSDPHAYGIRLTKQAQDLLGQADPLSRINRVERGVVLPPAPDDPIFPEYLKAQQEGRWTKPWREMGGSLRANITRAIGWDNLPLVVRKEAEAAGFTPITFQVAIHQSTVGDSLHKSVNPERYWETDPTVANRMLHGDPAQLVSKINEKIATRGEENAARIFLGEALVGGKKDLAVMSPQSFMKAISPGGSLSKVDLRDALITPFGNNLESLGLGTRSILAQKLLLQMKKDGLTPGMAKNILKHYGMMDDAIAGVLWPVSETGIKKAQGKVVTKAAETVDMLANKAASAGRNAADFWPDHQSYVGLTSKHHTKFKGSFIQKLGQTFKEGWLDTLYHRTWVNRHYMKGVVEEISGGRIRFSSDIKDIKQPEKGLRRWLFDKGHDWAFKGTGVKAQLGRAAKYVSNAHGLGGMALMWLPLAAYSSWQGAKEYKSQTVGFGIEGAKWAASISMYQMVQQSWGKAAAKLVAKKLIPLPLVDHLVAMGVSMVLDGIIHSITDTLAKGLGLKKEPAQTVPLATQYYMGNFPGLDDSQYLGQHGINSGFGTNHSGFHSGWSPPPALIIPPVTVPSIVRRQIPRQANGGLVQHLWKHRSSGGRIRSDHLPPPMMNSGVIAA